MALHGKKEEQLLLRELVQLYFEHYANARLQTASEMRADIERWFSPELSLRVSELSSLGLQASVDRLASQGKMHAANKGRNYLRAIINWGERKGLCSAECVKSLDGFRTVSRHRFVQPHEFKRLLDAIDAYPDRRIRDFFFMCLYTGARCGNVMAMRWEEISFDFGTWTIPRTKNGESLLIGLADAALEILHERHKSRDESPWVFPGGNPQNKVMVDNHLTEPKKAWKKIIDAAAIQDLRIHDLRRTAGSIMAISGINTPTIMQALGHKSMAAAAIYQRVNADPAKRGMDQAIGLMHRFAERGTNVWAVCFSRPDLVHLTAPAQRLKQLGRHLTWRY